MYYELWTVVVRCDCLKANVFFDYHEMVAYCEEQRTAGYVYEVHYGSGMI